MKIFKDKEGWEQKVNFVDENNVFLGYDMHQDCCEDADWFIADKPTKDMIENKEVDVSDYIFDTNYFKSIDHIPDEDYNNLNKLDQGRMVIFRIVNGEQEKFLHLYNCHNGYYGHGFEFKIGKEVKHQGSL